MKYDEIEEMRRVARRVVVFSWEPSFARRLWITAEYFPFVGDEEGTFPSLADQAGAVRATTSVSGAWAERHADRLERDELDLGYRLLVA